MPAVSLLWNSWCVEASPESLVTTGGRLQLPERGRLDPGTTAFDIQRCLDTDRICFRHDYVYRGGEYETHVST